jgi:hypothetical protein
MDEHKKHMDDLSEIRLMMERASKFISLSGLSGVLAGIFAFLGSAIAYWYLEIFLPNAQDPLLFKSLGIKYDSILFLLLLAAVIFLFAFLSGVYFTTRNSRKKNLPLWDHTSKKVIVNLFIPLFTGALFIISLIFNEFYLLIIPSSLIFYGLSLINAGHFTYSDIKYLGYIEIILGLICLVFSQWGLIMWTIGFGVMHIVYGILMFYKYEK